MNANQRRKAYRKIKSMIGAKVSYNRGDGIVNTGVIVGLTHRVYQLASTSDSSMFDGTRPSVHRARVELPSGSYQSPRLSKLVTA